MLTQQQLDTIKTIMDLLRIFTVFSVKESCTEIVICIIEDYVEWFSKYLTGWYASQMFQFCQDKYKLYWHQDWDVDK